MVSTAELNPPLAIGSVSYSIVNRESDVASVPSTCTAFANLVLKFEHVSSGSGGVIEPKSAREEESSSHGVAGDGGDGGGIEGA